MAVMEDRYWEVEVFGVTYERFALERLFRRLQKKLGLQTVLEMPAAGAKAMPSLYSLGFALAGCRVTLVDAAPEGLRVWGDLGLNDRLTFCSSEEIATAFSNGQRWDLCWNFAELSTSPDAKAMIQQMAKFCRWLMVVNVNRFNVGFFLHRAMHHLWKIPWTHGELPHFSPLYTERFLHQCGLRNVRWGVVDCPPWPDSPGFRDLRLHRLGNRPHRWVSPYTEYLKAGKFPWWIQVVYRLERLPLPAFVKLPYSHLYYAIGQVEHEADR